MTTQPGHYPQPTATPAGHAVPTHADREQAARWLAALDELSEAKPTAVRVNDPAIPSHKDGPRIGHTPPVQQPGRPSMSQRAVDLNTTLISSSVVIGMTGAAATGVLWASGHANATVIGWICGCIVAAPAVIAIPILALKGLVKSAKASNGKRLGTAGKKIGNVHVRWAVAEAAVLFICQSQSGKAYFTKLEHNHGKAKALTVLAHKLGPAVYYMLTREQVFDLQRFVSA